MTDKKRVVIALGSNTDAETHMEQAKRLVCNGFSHVRFSSAVWTEAIGMVSGPFLNCMASAETGMDVQSVLRLLKDIETRCGDRQYLRVESKVLMDADLLLYGSERHHRTDWDRPYIGQLYSELLQNR